MTFNCNELILNDYDLPKGTYSKSLVIAYLESIISSPIPTTVLVQDRSYNDIQGFIISEHPIIGSKILLNSSLSYIPIAIQVTATELIAVQGVKTLHMG